MSQLQLHFKTNLNWKWWGVLILFTCGFVGFLSGVEVSDRPGLPESSIFTKAYYTFGLFLLGGMDLGTPSHGPLYGKVLLWIAYFGAPILTASAVIESLVHALQPYSWRLHRIKNHIVIVGSGNLTFSFLKKIREHDSKRAVIVLAPEGDHSRLEELQSYGNIRIVVSIGDPQFLVRRLRMDRAHRILLLLDDDIANCVGATDLIENSPALVNRIILHIADLQFLHVLQTTDVALPYTSFNSYQMAAAHLARQYLIKQFNSTHYKDTLVLVGFGRFGQSILAELEQKASDAFSTVAIIDIDARRNALISDEATGKDKVYERYIIEGDIGHPEVWDQLFKDVVVADQEPVFILSTGSDEKNIGSAIRLRQRYKDALIISRSLQPSMFASKICKEHNIVSINMTELMEESIPQQWYLD